MTYTNFTNTFEGRGKLVSFENIFGLGAVYSSGPFTFVNAKIIPSE